MKSNGGHEKGRVCRSRSALIIRAQSFLDMHKSVSTAGAGEKTQIISGAPEQCRHADEVSTVLMVSGAETQPENRNLLRSDGARLIGEKIKPVSVHFKKVFGVFFPERADNLASKI